MKAVPFFLVLLLPWIAVAQDKPTSAKATQDLRQKLQEGLFEEEANRNLEKASEAYEGLLSAYENDRKYAATALFRLGEIRVKQNRKEDAIALFQRVIAEFGGDPLAKLSRDRLASLGGEVPKAGEGVPSSQEEREIARLQDLVKNSPDLLNAVDSGTTPLARAAMEGWLKAANFLMDHGVDPKSKHGEEALRLAAATGRKAMVELLLSRGVDVNARDENSGTALMRAVQASHAEVTRLLLERGASPNIGTKENATPLHAACSQGDLELVRMLLEKGADLNAASTAPSPPGNNGGTFGTPLMIAVRGGHRKVMNLLLERKADVNFEIVPNLTALWLAVERNDRDAVAILLQHGAKPADPRLLQSTIAQQNLELVQLLAKHGADVNAKLDERGHAPLHLAVGVSAALVRFLLESGAKPNVTNNEGETPLSSAMIWFSRIVAPSASSPPLLGVPRHPGSVPRVRMPRGPISSETTSIAPKNDSFEICQLLIAKGADVNARNSHGISILHKALQDPMVPLEVVDWLIEKGADVNAKSKNGYTPAMIAPVDRRIWLEERTVFPNLAKQRAIHTFIRFAAQGKDLEPFRVEPVSEFDFPPAADELIRRSAADFHEAFGWKFDIYVYRAAENRELKRVSVVKVSNEYISEDLPQLEWGDVVVVAQGKGEVRLSNTGAQMLRDWRPDQKTPEPGMRISVQLGPKDAEITMRAGIPLPNPSTSETPEWLFSDLVKAMTAAEPRADLSAIKIQRTVDSKPKEWTADLRPEKPGQEVKKLPAHLGNGDRVIIPLKPENDPAALAKRKAGIFRRASGHLFGERVFHFTEKDDAPRTLGDVIAEAYSGSEIIIPNPDLSKIRIRRLKDDTGAEETLEVNLAERIETISAGTLEEDARKQDIPLKPGDIVEWASKTDRPVTEWNGLDGQARLFLNKALRRDVTVNTIGQKRDEFLLKPYFVDYIWSVNQWGTTSTAPFRPFRGLSVVTPDKNLLKVRLISGERIREFSAEEFSTINPRLQDGDLLEVERF